MHALDLTTLRTAIPYIRAYKGRVFVIKLGGSLCRPGPVIEHVIEQCSLLYQLGIHFVIVHGGGEQIGEWCDRLGIEKRVVAGRRVTDARTLDVAKMVFGGLINTEVVAACRKHELPAIGLSGVSNAIVSVRRRPPQSVSDPSTGRTEKVDFGFVGDVVDVNTDCLRELFRIRYVPVLSCLAADDEGQVYNVNADTVASSVAASLSAAKYFAMTTVDGVMRDVDDPSTLCSHLSIPQLEELIDSGVVSGGMLPKLKACIDALNSGVERVHIINGTTRDTLLAEIFTNEGCGTLLTARAPDPVKVGT